MSATTGTGLNAGRAGGLAIMLAVVVNFFASLLFPGGPVFDTVDQTDFGAAVTAMGNSPGLSHATTIGVIIGMLLYGYGFIELLRLRGQGAGFSASLLRFGIVASLFSWGIFIISFGMRLAATYFMEQSLGAGEGSELQAEFASLALFSQVTMVGLILAFMIVSPFGTAFVGLGLVARISKLNIYMLACYGLVVVGAGAFINLTLALVLPELDVTLHLTINQIFLFIGSLCLFAVGAGMYAGREELVAAEAAG